MSKLWKEKWGKDVQKRPANLTVKIIKNTMNHIMASTKVWGPMELVYKTARAHGLETLPYHTFTLWLGIADKFF